MNEKGIRCWGEQACVFKSRSIEAIAAPEHQLNLSPWQVFELRLDLDSVQLQSILVWLFGWMQRRTLW